MALQSGSLGTLFGLPVHIVPEELMKEHGFMVLDAMRYGMGAMHVTKDKWETMRRPYDPITIEADADELLEAMWLGKWETEEAHGLTFKFSRHNDKLYLLNYAETAN